jgi:hypothetical protein
MGLVCPNPDCGHAIQENTGRDDLQWTYCQMFILYISLLNDTLY